MLKLTKTTNLVSSLVSIFTKILSDCVTLNCRSSKGNITHVQSGIPPFCLDAESSILSQEKHCRSRILVDLKTLIGHSIVSEVTVLGLLNNDQANVDQASRTISPPRLYMDMLNMFATERQAMNSQRRETAAHIPYENKAFKVAFLLELELLFVSSSLAATIEALPSKATNPNETVITNYNTRVLHNILGTTLNALLHWLDTTCFTP